MKNVSMQTIKKDLLKVMKYYINNDKSLSSKRVRTVKKLYSVISSHVSFSATHTQLRILIECALFYDDNVKSSNKISDDELTNLKVILLSSFATTLPRKEALKVASKLATHKPNEKDIENILKM